MSELRIGASPVTISRAVSIVGRVIDAASRGPLAGALVRIVSGPAEFEARRAALAQGPAGAGQIDRRVCDEGGDFHFAGLPEGSYALEARAPHLGTRYAERASAAVSVVRPTARARFASVELGLEPTRVAGTVTAAGGAVAVGGAELRLRSGEAAARAAADGSYVLAPVPAGGLTIDVSAAGFVAAAFDVRAAPGKTTDKNIALAAVTISEPRRNQTNGG